MGHVSLRVHGIEVHARADSDWVSVSTQYHQLITQSKVPGKIAEHLVRLIRRSIDDLKATCELSTLIELFQSPTGSGAEFSCIYTSSAQKDWVSDPGVLLDEAINAKLEVAGLLLTESAEKGKRQEMFMITDDVELANDPNYVYSKDEAAVAFAIGVIKSGLIGHADVTVCGVRTHRLEVPTAVLHRVVAANSVVTILGQWVGLFVPHFSPIARFECVDGRRKEYEVRYHQDHFLRLCRAFGRNSGRTWLTRLQRVGSVNGNGAAVRTEWSLVWTRMLRRTRVPRRKMGPRKPRWDRC